MATVAPTRALIPAELKSLRPAGGYTFDELYRLAQVCQASGLFEDVADAAQAMMKIVKGQELGIPPTTAMAGFDIIKKRLFIKPWVIAAKINACGYGGYRLTEQTPERCTILFLRKYHDRGWVECPLVTYTFAEAKAHGLVDRSPHWKASPAHMLYQRAMGRGGAMYFPELLAGLDVPPDDAPLSSERHHKNISDLFGDAPVTTEPLREPPEKLAEVIEVETSTPDEWVDTPETNLEPPRGPKQASASDALWRDTLEAHKDDKRLPEALRTKVKLALNPASETSDSKGLELAGAVLDWINTPQEAAP